MCHFFSFLCILSGIFSKSKIVPKGPNIQKIFYSPPGRFEIFHYSILFNQSASSDRAFSGKLRRASWRSLHLSAC